MFGYILAAIRADSANRAPTLHNWFDPIEAISKLAVAQGLNLLTPRIGRVVEVGKDEHFARWWQPLLPQ